MCTSDKKFSYVEVYELIQVSVTYIQKTSQIWILKFKDPENLYFDITFKLNFVNNII